MSPGRNDHVAEYPPKMKCIVQSQPSFRFALPAASDEVMKRRCRFSCLPSFLPRFLLAVAAAAACFPPGVLLVFWGNNLNFVRLGAALARPNRPSSGRSG